MFKVGDKVKRTDLTMEWCTSCFAKQLWPYGVFTIAKINYGITLEELPNKMWDDDRFKPVGQEQTEIQVGDVYKTRNGCSVRIVATDVVSQNIIYTVLGLLYVNGREEATSYTKDGSCSIEYDSPHNLILPWKEPKVDWAKVPVDTLIKIDTDLYRYFAGTTESPDIIKVFLNGATSKTTAATLDVNKVRCTIVNEEN